jgi:hypothetical protein
VRVIIRFRSIELCWDTCVQEVTVARQRQVFLSGTIRFLGFDSRGGGTGNFSLHNSVQNGSGAHPASYPMGNRGSFSGGKAAGA